VAQTRLLNRCPVIVRVDGKAFHSLTRGMGRPFDLHLRAVMCETAKYLCARVQGSMVAYIQSDEISLFLNTYLSLDCDAWFDNEVQKQASVAASMATVAFNQAMALEAQNVPEEDREPYLRLGMFDARCFNVPREDVTNYFVWRQRDAVRNSIQMVAQANFSHRELQGKSCDELQEMLFRAHGINWAKLPTALKRGVCVVREAYLKDEAVRHRWVADLEIPEFTQDRHYIERFVDATTEARDAQDATHAPR